MTVLIKDTHAGCLCADWSNEWVGGHCL